VRWQGKDVSEEPYNKKLELLRAAVKEAPWLKIPRTAETQEEKDKLVADIREGKEPSTEEGVIEWHRDRPLPKKSKFLREQDVYVKDIFLEQGKRQGLAGGFEYSLTPDGPTVGRVGTGFSHDLKRDMAANPERYKGLHARVAVQPAPTHYAARAPSFKSWHLDVPLPEGTKTAAQENPMPKWIHDRADHILAKNPSMPKSEAFAIATQQAHAVGKSPKGYGTHHGRTEAREKYKTPGDDMKTANPGHLKAAQMTAFFDELEKAAGFLDRTLEALGRVNRGGSFVGGAGGKSPSEGFKAFQEQMAKRRIAAPAAAPAPISKPPPPMRGPLNPGGGMS